MTHQIVCDFPPIETAYVDEFGTVDPEVYQTAKLLWSSAEHLAVRCLHDRHEGIRLMIKAVASVSRVRENAPTKIKNLRAYLYLSYKRLVLAELEKTNGHQRQLVEKQFGKEILENDATQINRQILINELRRQMDEWTRDVFDLLCLGYTFEELVPEFGKKSNAVRSKYSKNVTRLARQIRQLIEVVDQQI